MTQHEPRPSHEDRGSGASAEPGAADEFDHGTHSEHAATPESGSAPAPETDAEPSTEGEALASEDALAASYLADLKRLQAEYVNYKKRVDRDRNLIRTNAVSSVVESLLPVLDDIYSARTAGDLTDGPFAAIAEKLEGILAKSGITRVGEPGEPFDPNVHEAMVHVDAELPEGATDTTVVQVLQPGYKNGDRLVRAARVSVADPS